MHPTIPLNLPSHEHITYDSTPDDYYFNLGILKDNIVHTMHAGLNQLYNCIKLELSRLNKNDELNMLIDFLGGNDILMYAGKDYKYI